VAFDESIASPEGTAVRIEIIAGDEKGASHVSRGAWKGAFRDSGPVPLLDDIRAVRREHWPSG